MGFFSRLGDAVRGFFSSAPVERQDAFTPSDLTGGDGGGGDFSGGESASGYGDTFVTDASNPPGQDAFDFDFQLSGWLPLDGTFNDDYVNLEGSKIDLDYDVPWADLDYFVIQVNEPGRDPYYVTITGPFDDYDDLMAHIAEWWEQGS
jgi:hypothetical protein